MALALIDLLWRHHPDAQRPSRRGPRSTRSTDEVVLAAMAMADSHGIGSLRMRELADQLGMSTMSMYTYVGSREDLLALMIDTAIAEYSLPSYGRAGWRSRLRRTAEANLNLYRDRPWLLDIADDRTAVGPGTIAKYDHELHCFDDTELADVERDAALTHLLSFVQSTAQDTRRQQIASSGDAMLAFWQESAGPLGNFLADNPFPLAARVGQAAGEEMNAAFSATHAYQFGLTTMIDGLQRLISERAQ